MRSLPVISLAAGALLLLGTEFAYPTSTLGAPQANEEDPDCGTSCARPNPSDHDTPPSQDEFTRLLADWSKERLSSPSLALETLLFHAEHSLAFLDRLAPDSLPPDRLKFLRGELLRNRAQIELRIIDEQGVLRGEISAADLALGQPTHRHLTGTGDLGEIELSGQVRRVGLDHLWSRW